MWCGLLHTVKSWTSAIHLILKFSDLLHTLSYKYFKASSYLEALFYFFYLVPGSCLGLYPKNDRQRQSSCAEPCSKTCDVREAELFSLASAPELLPSAEHAAGRQTPGTQPHVTRPTSASTGKEPTALLTADEDKPVLVAAAAPALCHQVLNVLKLSCPWAALSLSCRPLSHQSQVWWGSDLLLFPAMFLHSDFSSTLLVF